MTIFCILLSFHRLSAEVVKSLDWYDIGKAKKTKNPVFYGHKRPFLSKKCMLVDYALMCLMMLKIIFSVSYSLRLRETKAALRAKILQQDEKISDQVCKM